MCLGVSVGYTILSNDIDALMSCHDTEPYQPDFGDVDLERGSTITLLKPSSQEDQIIMVN